MDEVQGGPATSPREPDAGKQQNNPPRRRNRPALSCIQCRSRKIRCNREEPCQSCLKSKIVNCSYEESRRPKPRLWKLSPGPSDFSATPAGPSAPEASSTEGPSPGSLPAPFVLDRVYRDGRPYGTASGVGHTNSTISLNCGRPSGVGPVSSPTGPHVAGTGYAGPTSTVAELTERVQQLEKQLAEALKSKPSCTIPSISNGLVTIPARSGTAHWVDGKQFPMLSDVANRLVAGESSSEAHMLLQHCRLLVRNRTPQVPTLDIGKHLPPENICNRLLNAYFRTFEGVFRILHEPTFLQAYREYWDDPASAEPTFVLQLQLCMAIGACFQDDVVELRQAAVGWIFEAQIWLASPSRDSQLTLAGLQVMCLLHLARDTCGGGGDFGCLSGGAMLRCAMRLNLHRDPSHFPRMSSLGAELRRRLWATILEFELQCTMDAGGPPLITPYDYDTRPPSNYDDEQLSNDPKVATVPRPSSAFTQTSVQLALLQSLTTRISIADFLNKLDSDVSYDATIRWNTELSGACRVLTATLQPSYDPAGVLPKRLSLFQLRLAEHTVHRFFLAVNRPWLVPSQNNPAFCFSRKMCVETALKLTRCLSRPSTAADSASSQQTDDFSRLSTCGFRGICTVLLQCVATIALELFWQAQEDRNFRQSMNIDTRLGGHDPGEVDGSSSGGLGGGVASRTELYEALKLCVLWHQRRIRAGDTNVKDFCFTAASLAHVEAMQRGADDLEMANALESSLTDALRHAYDVLKELHGANEVRTGVYAPRDWCDSDELGGDVNMVLGRRWDCD